MRLFPRVFVPSAVALLVAASVPAADDRQFEPTGSVLDPFLGGVERTVLGNGLTVLFRPQPGAGVVAINTWVRAGYFHEPDSKAGMAHLFEHMFFKGSSGFPGAEQIAQEVTGVGGQLNAGTIYDSTDYYFVLPSDGFERGMAIQADAVMNPLFEPAELAKEAEVVIEESNRKLDNPPAVSMERMFATAFSEHRMRRWRIGSNDVLRNIRRDDLLGFFQGLYRPENMILAIAGDVTPERVAAVLDSTFAKIPRGQVRKARGPTEPPQRAFRYGQSAADLAQGYSVLGWHTPGVGSDDDVALEVLASILGQGRSSRLYRNAVGPDAASTVFAGNWQFEDVGIFVVQASFDEANRQEVDRRILREVARMRRHGPTVYELQLAKNVVESDVILGLETVLGQAHTLAAAEATYGYRELGVRLARLSRLTPDQIKAAADRYLKADNLTLYHYRPEDTVETTSEQALALVTGVTAGAELVAEQEIPLPAAPTPVAGAGSDGGPRESELANGMTLVVEQRTGAPVVSMGVYFRGGRIGETSRNAGITQLMTQVMRRGTATRTAEQIDREIEFLGTQIRSSAGADYFGFELTILGRNLRTGLELLADVVRNPTFPEEELREARQLQLAAIRRSLDSSTQRPFQLLYATHYGNHPYALPGNGFESSVEVVRRDDLVAWWRTWVCADDALVVIVGDIAADDAKRLAERQFAGIPKRQTTLDEVPPVTPPPNRIQTVEFRDRRQSAIAIAYRTVPVGHDDWPRLRLLQNVTSGLAGTFFAELRGNRSLAYTVFAREGSQRDDGIFYGYMATDVAKEEEATEALIAEFRRLDEDGFSADDVARAKAYFAGSTRIGRQQNAAHVAELADAWMNGLGLDFTDRLIERIAALSAEDLREAAATYLDGDTYTLAVVSGRREPGVGASDAGR